MKILSLVFIILGYFLGAGFISGKEIASYFSVYGEFSVLGIVISAIILFFLILLFLNLSDKVNNFGAFVEKYFGKFSKLINFLFAVCILIVTSSMFAGNRVIGEILGLNGELFTILICVLTSVIIFFSFKGLSFINNICVPIILITILIISKTNASVNFVSSNNLVGAFVSSINYVFINIVTLGLLILEVGHKFTKREKLLSAIIVSIIILALMLLSNKSIIVSHEEYSTMPLLNIASHRGNFVWWLTSLTIWIGLFTTLVSCVYILSNYFNRTLNNKILSIIISLILGVVISYLGFDIMVGYVYSIIGIIGGIMVLRVLIKEKPLKYRG